MLQLLITGFTDTRFTAPDSLQAVNRKIYNAFGDSDESSQEAGVNGTRDLLHIWHEGWDLEVDEVVAATGISADRIKITVSDCDFVDDDYIV